MVTKEEILETLIGTLKKSSFFNDFILREHKTGEYEFFHENGERRLRLSWRFLERAIGYEIDQLSSVVSIKPIEFFLNPIFLKYDLKSSNETLMNTGESHRDIFLEICSGTVTDLKLLDKVSRSFEKYINIEIVPFFDKNSTVEGIGEFILQNEFRDVINIGIQGDYPTNVLKAIAIAYWCGNSLRSQEYVNEYQSWIEEDRSNPKYEKMCDNYQGALDELKGKLGSA